MRKMAELKISPAAIDDLKEIRAYITNELCNPSAAENVIDKIMKCISRLEAFPLMGAPLDLSVDFPTDYRFVICSDYAAFYRYNNNIVYVVRILYGKRDYARLLFDK